MEPVRGPESPRARLDRAVARMNEATADILDAVVECARTKRFLRDGATCVTAWLTARYRMTWGAAQEWVRVAQALQHLPAIRKAFEDGRLSWHQLQPLVRFATPETDASWAGKAPLLTPPALWQEQKRHRRIASRDAQEAHRRRYLDLTWDREAPAPVLYLDGRLGAEQGTALEAALRKRAETVPADPDAELGAQARMADALVDAVCGDPEPATVVVHAGAEVLARRTPRRGPWLAETEAGERLVPESVRRMACDGRIEWVFADGGKTVGIGRRGRQVPQAIALVLRHRDGGRCRFPGCHHSRWLNAHHLIHWAEGGATDLDNLVLLCHAHHRLIHEGGWRTSGHPERDLRFHDPRGQPLAAPT